MALESILHGIQVISVTKANITQLDSIQASFAADLIGVKRSSSHAAILRELGWNTLSSTIMKRKLLFWARLSKLDDNTWANKALKECMSAQKPHSGGWKSDYRMEIQKLHTECRIGNILKNGQTPKNNIKQAINNMKGPGCLVLG